MDLYYIMYVSYDCYYQIFMLCGYGKLFLMLTSLLQFNVWHGFDSMHWLKNYEK